MMFSNGDSENQEQLNKLLFQRVNLLSHIKDDPELVKLINDYIDSIKGYVLNNQVQINNQLLELKKMVDEQREEIVKLRNYTKDKD